MCCMNRTSAGEGGGNVGLVDDGNVRVGSPGAPGWTTTGVFGFDCCAKSGGDNRHTRVHAAKSLHDPARATDRIILLSARHNFIGLEQGESLEGFHVNHKATC